MDSRGMHAAGQLAAGGHARGVPAALAAAAVLKVVARCGGAYARQRTCCCQRRFACQQHGLNFLYSYVRMCPHCEMAHVPSAWLCVNALLCAALRVACVSALQ